MAASDTTRASLFSFIGAGLEEEDCPSFAAALDEYVRAERDELRRKLTHSERIRENADFHLGQEMARRQMADKETARLRAELAALPTPADQAVEERVARHLAAKHWLHQEDRAWQRLANIPDDYLDIAREVIALVQADAAVPSAPADRAVNHPRSIPTDLPGLSQDEEIALLRLTVTALEEGRADLRAENARLRAQLWKQPADRDALRDRIAAVIHDDLTSHKGRRDLGLLGIVPRLADAVLAVLPAPADRAATLRELEQRYRPNTPPSRP
jgi:uncharacterized small protein (DUF1192 family)